MRFIYKSIIDQIIDTQTKADEQGREILKVQLSRNEYFTLCKEVSIFRKEGSFIDIMPGIKGEFNGLIVEVV